MCRVLRFVVLALAVLGPLSAARAQPSPDSLLLRAARAGDLSALRLALARGASPAATDTARASALMLATVGGHEAAVLALLKAGARCTDRAYYRPGRTGYYGSLLTAAAAEGHLGMLRTLAARCALPLDAPEQDLDGRPDWTPVQSAAANDRLEVATYLVEAGARLGEVGGTTALDLALSHGAQRVTRWLLARDAPSRFSPTDRLFLTAREGDAESMAWLIARGVAFDVPRSDGMTPLLAALNGGHVAVAADLLDRGADARRVSSTGSTALHYVARTPQGAALVSRLVALGVPVDARDADGATALGRAVLGSRVDLVRALVAAGADPSAVAPDGWTALHIAARDGLDGLADTLLAAGVPLSVATPRGMTPYLLAARNGHARLLARLACAGADVTARLPTGEDAVALAAEGTVTRVLASRIRDTGCAAAAPWLRAWRLLYADLGDGFDGPGAVDSLRAAAIAFTSYAPAVGLFDPRLALAIRLRQRDRPADALAVLDRLAPDTARVDPELLRTWVEQRALVLAALDRPREAVPVLRRLIALEAEIGTWAREAQAHRGLVQALTVLGDDAAAIDAQRDRLDRTRARLGDDDPAVMALVLESLDLIDSDRMQAPWRRALLTDWTARAEATQPDSVRALWRLYQASDRFDAGDVDGSLRFYREAHALADRSTAPLSPTRLAVLQQLITVYRGLARYDEGRPYVDEALRIADGLARDGRDARAALGVLTTASFYLEGQGDDVASGEAARRALALIGTTSGADDLVGLLHVRVGTGLVAQGRHAEGAAALQQGVILFARQGAETSAAPDALVRMATVLQSLGERLDSDSTLANADTLYRLALARLGPPSPTVALGVSDALAGRADVAAARGDLVTADRLYTEAADVLVAHLPDARRIVTRRTEQARARLALGEAEAAEAFARDALAREDVAGTDLTPTLLRLAFADTFVRARPAFARECLDEARRRMDDHLDTVLPALSLAEQQRFLDDTVAPYVRLLVTALLDAPDAATYAALARTKGLLLRTLGQQARLSRTDAPEADALVRARRDLAAHLDRRPALAVPGDSAALAGERLWTQRLADLTAARERAERALQRIPSAAPALADPLPRGADVRTHLRPDEALVDLYRVALPGSPARPGAPSTSSGVRTAAYVAVVAAQDTPVRIVRLGAADSLDAVVDAWRAAVRRGQTGEADLAALDRTLWQPLLAALPGSVRRLWLSPDGQLARFPFDLLVAGVQRPVDLALLDSPRDLAALRLPTSPAVAATNTPARLLLVGDVAFGGDGRPFAPLPGTATEIDAVARLATTRGTGDRETGPARAAIVRLTGTEASRETVLAALPGAHYVHLATHGTFAATPPGDYTATRTVKPFARPRRSTETATRSPLLESGLAFAGANAAARPSASPTDTTRGSSAGAGLVTAEEFVGIDLSAARLVVLSACETGRGREITGQGVMGLRASFTTAGARTLLMSLWPVPDAATARLMEVFYEGLWRDGLTPGEALRRAQADVRAAFPAPVNWAAWVLAGEAW